MFIHIFKDRFRNQLVGRDIIFLITITLIGGIVLFTFGRQPFPNYKTSFCRPSGSSSGSDSFSIYAPTTASYLVWLHVEVPMQISFNDLPDVYNPLLVAVDNNQCYMVGNNQNLTLNSWTWIDQLNVSPLRRFRLNLTRGLHTFTVSGIYSSIDRVELVDNGCIPSGNGNDCANLN